MNRHVVYPQTTVIRSGINAGKVAVEFGPRGPIFLLAPDGELCAIERAPARGDAVASPLWPVTALRRPSATFTQ